MIIALPKVICSFYMKAVANKTGEMTYDFKQIYFMAKNLIFAINLLPRIKHLMLSYPTHFLKIGVYLFWINFLANKIRQSKPLARRHVFIPYLLQIEQTFGLFI